MKKMISFWLFAALFVVFGLLAGCGNDATAAKQESAQVQAPAVVVQKSTLTFLSSKSQIWQFATDEKGNIKDLRDGGIEIKPSDVDYVVRSSYRFGNWLTSSYKSALGTNGKVVFSGLPNNDQWTEGYVVLKNPISGKKVFKVEFSRFEVVELPGFYYWIDPSNSGMEYGEIEADSAQDRMELNLDPTTMMATLKIQFGCDLIFGTLQSVNFEPGLKVVVELGDGTTYAGNLVQGVDGNLSAELPLFAVTAGPYTYPGYVYDVNYPAYDPTVIKDIYILKLDGTKVSLRMRYNTPNNQDESSYVWYVDTYNPAMAGSLSLDDWQSEVITLKYYPPYN